MSRGTLIRSLKLRKPSSLLGGGWQGSPEINLVRAARKAVSLRPAVVARRVCRCFNTRMSASVAGLEPGGGGPASLSSCHEPESIRAAQ